MDPTQPSQPSNLDLIKADLAPIGRGIQRFVAPIQSAVRGTSAVGTPGGGFTYHDGGESDPNLNRRFDRFMGLGPYAKPASPTTAPAPAPPAASTGSAASPRIGMNGFGFSLPSMSLPRIGMTGFGVSFKPATAAASPASAPAAPAPSMSAASESTHLPDWARSDVARGGGNPRDFGVTNGMLVSNKPMSQDFRPGVTVPGTSVAPGRPGVQPQAATLVPPPASVPTTTHQGTGSTSSIAPSPSSATSAPAAPQAGNADPFQRAMLANLRDAQSSFRGGTAQDWAAHRAEIAGLAGEYQKYRLGVAQAAHYDPMSKIGVLDAVNANPQRRATALQMNGTPYSDIGELPSIPRPGESPFNATNYESAGLANRETAEPTALLRSAEPFHRKVAMFAGMPGIDNPANPNRQLFDAYMASRQAEGQGFANELAQYGVGDDQGFDLSSATGVLGQIIRSAKEGLVGADPAIAARNRQLHADMARLGYAPQALDPNAGNRQPGY